jgi:hypothetical protein
MKTIYSDTSQRPLFVYEDQEFFDLIHDHGLGNEYRYHDFDLRPFSVLIEYDEDVNELHTFFFSDGIFEMAAQSGDIDYLECKSAEFISSLGYDIGDVDTF